MGAHVSQLTLKELDEAMRQERGRGFAKVQFLANLDYVKRHLAAGFTKRAVWRQLNQHGQFDAAYQQFLTYVDKLVTPKKATLKASSLPDPTAQPTIPVWHSSPPAQPSAEKPRFTVDPWKDQLKTVPPKNTPSEAQKSP